MIDDLASFEPWQPSGIKVRGRAILEDDNGRPRIRIRHEIIWSWGPGEAVRVDRAPQRLLTAIVRSVRKDFGHKADAGHSLHDGV